MQNIYNRIWFFSL